MPDLSEHIEHQPSPEPEPAVVRHPDGRIEHPRVRHEQTDVLFTWVLIVILAACAVLAGQYYVVWAFFQNRQAAQAKGKQSPFPLAPRPSDSLPSEPRLEEIDRQAGIEASNVRARELTKEQLLHRYGPAADKEFVHVPIERAMQKVLADLPVRPQSERQNSKDAGLVGAGASNSGRRFRGAPQW